MSELNDLYQEVILEHNKNPRNFREIENADRTAVGNNPLCGDALRVYLSMDGDQIADVAFKGSGCAISKASASMMTQMLKGKTREDADVLFDEFHRMVTGSLDGTVRVWRTVPLTEADAPVGPGHRAAGHELQGARGYRPDRRVLP